VLKSGAQLAHSFQPFQSYTKALHDSMSTVVALARSDIPNVRLGRDAVLSENPLCGFACATEVFRLHVTASRVQPWEGVVRLCMVRGICCLRRAELLL
jgi:hypothetical protein